MTGEVAWGLAALRVAAHHQQIIFAATPDLYYRPLYSGEVQYQSGALKKTICSSSEGWRGDLQGCRGPCSPRGAPRRLENVSLNPASDASPPSLGFRGLLRRIVKRFRGSYLRLIDFCITHL